MAQLGSGIIPSGAIGTELSYLTRRGFIYRLIVQLYNASPTYAAMLSGAQPASGGVSPITVPVQGATYTTPQDVDYSGSFNAPTVGQGAYNAEFNLCGTLTPIPFLGFEGLVQINEAVIRRLDAVMNDAKNGMVDFLASAWFANATNTLRPVGFFGAIDDGTNLSAYGGLNRTSYTWWQSKRYNSSTSTPTRNLMLQYVIGTIKNCGEKPSWGVMGPGTWNLLAQDFTSQERYMVTGTESYADNQFGARAAFQALMVSGVPIYLDAYTPEGTLWLHNDSYGAYYIHENVAFAFTGFQSLIPINQVGYQGALLLLSQYVLTKPKSCTVVSPLAYTTL